MPLLKPTNDLIRVPLSDRKFDDTIIKQEAVFSLLQHRQVESTGECSAQVAVTIKAYSDNAGAYGIHLHEKGIFDRTEYLTADNDTLVDAADGSILLIKTNENRNDWNTLIAEYEQDVVLQGDFFWMLRSQPIVINDLIRLHIGQADAMGKFA